MALVKFKPTTPGRRFGTTEDFSDITASRPQKSLTVPKKKTGGRNLYGHITAYHVGGGHKQRIRLIDFKRLKHGVAATVETIEYDPMRTTRIALIKYSDGEKAYILSPDGLKVGSKVMSGEQAEVKVGNHLPLQSIPEGTSIHNIELEPGRGGKLVRSAGGVAQILAKEGSYAHVKLPSSEVRMIKINSYATVGQCSNSNHINVSLGKAGRKRWMGVRSIVRGVARNPVDHPMGGGEGKAHGGRQPCSAWGQLSKGLKTRNPHKVTNQFIVKRKGR